MSFRSKALLFSLAVALVAMLLAGLVAASIRIVVDDNDRMERIARFSDRVRDAETLASEVLLGGGERPLHQWQLLSDTLRDHLEGLDGPSLDQTGLRAELQSRLLAMDRAFVRLAGTADDPTGLARSVLVSQIRANKDALVSRVGALQAEVEASHQRTYDAILIAQAVVIGLLILLALAHYVLTRRFLLSTLDDLTAAILGLREGRLGDPIPVRRADEIGQLMTVLEDTRGRLYEVRVREDLARRRAEELSRAKSRFIASVSHELRTPLMGLLGMLDLADRREQFVDIKHDVAQARAAGGHLLSLINNVLDFSKIEADRIDLAEEPFDPDLLVRSAETVFASQAWAKGLSLMVVPGSVQSPSLVGDAQRLSQVVFNLVGNAIKFTQEGVVTVSHRVERCDDGLWRLRVEVTDTGPGIPSEECESIFEEFSQVGDGGIGGGQIAGTGLGLAISARLVRQMGGEITVDSEIGKGSRFSFWVALPEAASAAEDQGGAEARPTRGLTLLLAEDVALNRMIVADYLEGEGHRVDQAENGLECLEILRSGAVYDAVLMDVNMPEMDGIEATRAIRADAGPWRSIPIIGLTANAFQEQVKGYLEAGMTTCVAKPVDWPVLLRKLAEIAGGAEPSKADDAVATAVAPSIDAQELPLVAPEQLQDLTENLGLDRAVDLHRRAADRIRESLAEVRASAGDSARLAREIHTLRGLAANLGYVRLAWAAGQMEEAAEHADGGSPDVEEMSEILDLTVQAVADEPAMAPDRSVATGR